jgi:hypothetical protein
MQQHMQKLQMLNEQERQRKLQLEAAERKKKAEEEAAKKKAEGVNSCTSCTQIPHGRTHAHNTAHCHNLFV